MKSRPIEFGAIVKGNPKTSTIKGYYRIRSIRGRFANLASPFGWEIIHKSVPVKDLVECHDEWYEAWSKTEAYQCM